MFSCGIIGVGAVWFLETIAIIELSGQIIYAIELTVAKVVGSARAEIDWNAVDAIANRPIKMIDINQADRCVMVVIIFTLPRMPTAVIQLAFDDNIILCVVVAGKTR